MRHMFNPRNYESACSSSCHLIKEARYPLRLQHFNTKETCLISLQHFIWTPYIFHSVTKHLISLAFFFFKINMAKASIITLTSLSLSLSLSPYLSLLSLPYKSDLYYFQSLGGCNRCQMINLGIETGRVKKSTEPLATLASYRRVKVTFNSTMSLN